MKKLLALVLSMLLVASCFALVAVAEEETDGEIKTVLVFDAEAKAKKILGSQNGINKAFYNSDGEWEGAKLRLTDVGDPYVQIGIKKAEGMDKIDSQAYPFVVFKLKIEGWVDDIELFYCAGVNAEPDPAYATTTDYPPECSGEVEYIIYDLTGDCEGIYSKFRFDPMGAEEDTIIYLYEMAFFATEEEAFAYASLTDEGGDEPDQSEGETEAPGEGDTTVEGTTEADKTEGKTEAEKTEAKTEANKTEAGKTENKTEAPTTAAEKEGGCGGIVSIGAVVAMISLGVVCIKKKD